MTEYSNEKIQVFYQGGIGAAPGRLSFATIGGDVLTLPEKGGSLTLERYRVTDLMGRYNVDGKLVFTLTQVATSVGAPVERAYTRDELLAMLAQMTAPEEAPVELDFSNQPDADPPPINEPVSPVQETVTE